MNKQRLIISSVISIFLVATLLLGSTYSIFTSQEIDENTNVYTTGNLDITYKLDSNNIKFTDITPMNEEEADSVKPYRITVTNKGNVPYMFDVILTDTTSSEENTIDYQYIMTKVGYLEPASLSDCTDNIIKENVILPADSSVDIDVRIWISDSIQNIEIGKSFYSKLTIDGLAVYNDNTDIDNSLLSLRYMKNDSDYSFRSTDYKDKILTASFVDYIDASNASTNAETNEKIMWDMSTNQDKSIIAWLENAGTEGFYNLYIGSKNKIYAKSLYRCFREWSSLKNVNFDNLNTSLTTDMTSMFEATLNMINLDLSSFDTGNVVSMDFMFSNCKAETIDLSNFDTSNVSGMKRMFLGCSNVKTLDLSSFDTSKISGEWSMQQIFRECTSLESLNISNFDTSKITSMEEWFLKCENLKTIDLSSFDTSNVTNMTSMFSYCYELEYINFSDANFSNVTAYSLMFYYVPASANIIVKDEIQANWITEKFTNLTNVSVNT